MDPLSIAATVVALTTKTYSISTTLYSFIKAAKTVSEAVQGLCAEIDGLTHVLETLTESFRLQPISTAALESQSDGSLALWSSIEASLAECRSTIEKLNKQINGVRTDSEGHLRWMQQGIRQMMLNLEDEAIKGYRAQLHTHGLALQTILGTVNLYFNIKGPRLVIEELKPQLLELKASLAKIESNQSNQNRSPVSLTSAEEAILATTEHLRRSAEKVLSSASTIYSGTEAGGTDIDFRYSSEYGEPLNQARRDGIEKWISQPIAEAEEEEPSTKSGNPSETLSNPPTPIFSDTKQTTRSGLTTADSFTRDPDSDSDADVDVEFVQKIVDKARAHYAQQCLPEAEAWFQKSLQHAEKLSWRRQDSLGLTKVRLQYASCCFQQKKMVEAETSLLLLTTAKTIGDEDRVHVLQASHLLAHLYLRDRQFDKATEFCRRAMIGRRRMLGKSHPSHYETLSLLSVIYKCRGDLMEAETYKDMIPVHVVKDLVPFIAVTGDIDFPNPSHEYQEPSRSSHTDTTHEASPRGTSTHQETSFQGEAKEDIEVTSDLAFSVTSDENMEPSRSLIPDMDSETSSKQAANLHNLPFRNVRQSKSNENLETGIVGKVESGIQGAKPNARTDSDSKGLVVSFANRMARVAKGYTPLHVAVVDGDLEAVRYHIRGGGACEFLEAKNVMGNAAIHLAAERGHTPIIELLLDRGVNVNIQGNHASTPLQFASRHGHTKSVQLLLDRGARPGGLNSIEETPLLRAVANRHMEIVQILLDAGANIEECEYKGYRLGYKPLHLAVLSGHSSIVRLLLERAADVNSMNQWGKSPLMCIHQSHSVKILQMLIEEGANIHQTDHYRMNVLHYVIGQGGEGPAKNEIVRILLERGADLSKKNLNGFTPLYYIKRGDKELRDIVRPFREKSESRTGFFSRILRP